MKTDDFDYHLPPELIAQNPAVPRDHSRLFHLDRASGSWAHRRFFELDQLLCPGDVLVLNDTKVIPARLYGMVEGSGTGKVEVLILNLLEDGTHRVMAKPGKKLKPGRVLVFEEHLKAEVVSVEEDGCRLIRFSVEPAELQLILDRIGHAPIPPYIKESTATREQYQTVFARELGSSAAPTAGLHFTPELFERLEQRGVSVEKVTLHVGRGTFQDVKVDKLEEHIMHTEPYELPVDVAERINAAKAEGRRIIAVGTTSVRVLESCADENGVLTPGFGETSIFIYPGYKWKLVGAMVTNFHLPKSTLIMLISSFAGKDLVFQAYEEAVKEQYRFFSFGDGMFIE